MNVIITELLEPALAPATGPSPPTRDRSSWTDGWVSNVLPLVVYAGISLLAYWPLGPINNQRIVGCGCGDIALETWLVAWPSHAIGSGLNPFFTNALNVPAGVNLASNTNMVLLGLIATPFTRLFGAVAAFNFFMQLAFFASAGSMYLVLRRWTSWWPAAFVGGLFYGFSPYMIGQGYGHLFLAFVPIPPLVLAVLDNLVVRERWSSRRAGMLLGLLLAFQYLISAEVLADLVLLCVLGVVVLAVRHPTVARARARRVVTGGIWALLPFSLLTGFPIWFGAFGAQHVTGPWAPPSMTVALSADLLGPIVPTFDQQLGGQHWRALGTSLSGGGVVENGVYLGIPLVLACLILIILARRNGVVRFCAFMGLVSFVLSLGPKLHVDGHLFDIWLPFALFRSVPLIRNEFSIRYGLFTNLFVIVLFAVGLDEARRRFLLSSRHRRRAVATHTAKRPRRPHLGSVLALVVATIVALPLIPRLPYSTATTGVPAYFTSDALTGVDRIPRNTVVLTYPYPVYPHNFAMLWQAQSGMRFKIPGDYAITPAPNNRGLGTLAPPNLQPQLMQTLFNSGYSGGSAVQALPPPNASSLGQLRAFLVHYEVDTIIVHPVGADPGVVEHYLVDALGRPPEAQGGVLVWYHVQLLAH